MDGTASAEDVGLVLITAVALALVFAPLTSRLYRRRG